MATVVDSAARSYQAAGGIAKIVGVEYIMAALLMATAFFVGGFVAAWVLVWSAATRAMSRQSDRNLQQVGELNAQLRTLRAERGRDREAHPREYEPAS